MHLEVCSCLGGKERPGFGVQLHCHPLPKTAHCALKEQAHPSNLPGSALMSPMHSSDSQESPVPRAWGHPQGKFRRVLCTSKPSPPGSLTPSLLSETRSVLQKISDSKGLSEPLEIDQEGRDGKERPCPVSQHTRGGNQPPFLPPLSSLVINQASFKPT